MQLVREPLQRLAQRRPPALLRRPLRRHAAAAIGPPAFNTMRTAPRRGRDEPQLLLRRVTREKGGEVLDPHVGAPAKRVQQPGQRHFTEPVVVAIGLAVGRHGDELRRDA
jgi:hypothetical protein